MTSGPLPASSAPPATPGARPSAGAPARKALALAKNLRRPTAGPLSLSGSISVSELVTAPIQAVRMQPLRQQIGDLNVVPDGHRTKGGLVEGDGRQGCVGGV